MFNFRIMDGNVQSQQAQTPEVSFPQIREPEKKSSGVKLIIAVVGVMLIVIVGGWLILGSGGGNPAPSPTPIGGLSSFPTPAPPVEIDEPSPSPTLEPVDKSEVKVEVLNGTGVPGEASFIQSELGKLGFENVTAGNADSQTSTETVATYSRDLSSVLADEITAKLETIYTTVRTRKATVSGGFDVSITTGPRKSKTTTTASPTPTPEATR